LTGDARSEGTQDDLAVDVGLESTGGYVLRLYVAGLTASSIAAIARLKSVCEEHLPNRYDLEVIDIYQRPELARAAQIVAVPTLVKELPSPMRKLIGDLSNHERILAGLDIVRREP
jgi:circadian clock protein KaiB